MRWTGACLADRMASCASLTVGAFGSALGTLTLLCLSVELKFGSALRTFSSRFIARDASRSTWEACLVLCQNEASRFVANVAGRVVSASEAVFDTFLAHRIETIFWVLVMTGDTRTCPLAVSRNESSEMIAQIAFCAFGSSSAVPTVEVTLLALECGYILKEVQSATRLTCAYRRVEVRSC